MKVAKITRKISDSVTDKIHGFYRNVESLVLDGGEADLVVTIDRGQIYYIAMPPDEEAWREMHADPALSTLVEVDDELIDRLWRDWGGRRALYRALGSILTDASSNQTKS